MPDALDHYLGICNCKECREEAERRRK